MRFRSDYALATAVFLFFVYLASRGELQNFFSLVQPKGKTVNRTSGSRMGQTNTLQIPKGSGISFESFGSQLKNYGRGAIDWVKGSGKSTPDIGEAAKEFFK